MDKERIDEALELLWLLNEEDLHELERFKLSSEDDDIESLIDILKNEGLIAIHGDKIQFTDQGASKAKSLIRRLRLAERLFSDVFEMRGDSVITDACKMEHTLSVETSKKLAKFIEFVESCAEGDRPTWLKGFDYYFKTGKRPKCKARQLKKRNTQKEI